ncbi:unnamed protein product [Rhizoctonia solani]|uniref:Uncharacterized protein n=1 Tax=Rhizoctonia solani TaxID=456999 RepID=A0A8H3B4D1_9AGAM|nr:unnamed protein product [Rhizoctonia solani]
MVGRGLLTWPMSESGRVVGMVKEDYVDGEELEVLEVRLSLTPTVAVSRAQHATWLRNIYNSHSSSADPSSPTTPLTRPTVSQPTCASVRLRARSTKKSSVTPHHPHQPVKHGRPQKVIPPPPPEPEAQPASPGPSRLTHTLSCFSVSSFTTSRTTTNVDSNGMPSQLVLFSSTPTDDFVPAHYGFFPAKTSASGGSNGPSAMYGAIHHPKISDRPTPPVGSRANCSSRTHPQINDASSGSSLPKET